MFKFDFKHDKTPEENERHPYKQALQLLIIRLQLGCNCVINLYGT
jgi:hypothetical protein